MLRLRQGSDLGLSTLSFYFFLICGAVLLFITIVTGKVGLQYKTRPNIHHCELKGLSLSGENAGALDKSWEYKPLQ